MPAEELQRAKDQLKSSLMLSLERSTSRMSNLARQEMYFDRFIGLDETIEHIQAVSAEELTVLARERVLRSSEYRRDCARQPGRA